MGLVRLGYHDLIVANDASQIERVVLEKNPTRFDSDSEDEIDALLVSLDRPAPVRQAVSSRPVPSRQTDVQTRARRLLEEIRADRTASRLYS